MKTIYLVRHGKSSWKEANLKDYDRPLGSRGKRDAPFMGALLKKNNIFPDALISSPAKRAKSTAEIIAEQIGFPQEKIIYDKRIYEASASLIAEIIAEADNNFNSIMLFGHNPGFTSLSNFLSGEYIDNIPTCGIVCIEFDISNWNEIQNGNGRLKWFEFPKKYSVK